jgi:hypothetical protein
MVLGSLKLAAVIYHCQNKREKLFFITPYKIPSIPITITAVAGD